MIQMEQFKALASETRRRILKLTMNQKLHISEISRRLGISVPGVIKHIRILKSAGLIHSQRVGNLELIWANVESMEKLLDHFSSESQIKLPRGSNVLDALKLTMGIELRKFGEKQYLISVDGDRGYYIYEVDGVMPNLPLEEYILNRSSLIKLKKLIPVEKRSIKVQIQDEPALDQ